MTIYTTFTFLPNGVYELPADGYESRHLRKRPGDQVPAAILAPVAMEGILP